MVGEDEGNDSNQSHRASDKKGWCGTMRRMSDVFFVSSGVALIRAIKKGTSAVH